MNKTLFSGFSDSQHFVKFRYVSFIFLYFVNLAEISCIWKFDFPMTLINHSFICLMSSETMLNIQIMLCTHLHSFPIMLLLKMAAIR